MTQERARGVDRPANDESVGEWWNWRLLGRWIVVNCAAYLVIVGGGVFLQLLASDATDDLARNHRLIAILVIAIIGAGFQGFVLGRW